MDQIRNGIMGPQHADITYLQQDHIGAVVSKGLAATFEEMPKNPIEYFARWLLNHRQTEGKAEEVSYYF
jgi:hypothetical protein